MLKSYTESQASGNVLHSFDYSAIEEMDPSLG